MSAEKRIQEMHDEIMEAQKKKKEISKVIKEGYEGSKEYQDLVEELNRVKARKKAVEQVIRSQYSSEYNQAEDLAQDIRDTKMVLSDLMWNELIKNNAVAVTDEHDNRYVPHVVVTLKKEG